MSENEGNSLTSTVFVCVVLGSLEGTIYIPLFYCSLQLLSLFPLFTTHFRMSAVFPSLLASSPLFCCCFPLYSVGKQANAMHMIPPTSPTFIVAMRFFFLNSLASFFSLAFLWSTTTLIEGGRWSKHIYGFFSPSLFLFPFLLCLWWLSY